MIVIIRTTQPSTIRELLRLIEAIRYQNLYQHLEDLQKVAKQ